MYYAQIAIYAAASSLGLYLLKVAPGTWSGKFLTGLALYGAAFAFWLYLLKLYPLSKIFPVAAGSIMLGTQILGLLLLSEGIDGRKVAGVVAILAGIILLSPQSS